MFERFTERARLVIDISEASARVDERNTATSGDLLLALYGETEGLAAQTLRACGFVKPSTSPAWEDDSRSADSRFSDALRGVLHNALREALTLGHNCIGTEHLLLGVLTAPTSTEAQQMLAQAELSAADIREKLMQIVAPARVLPVSPKPERRPIVDVAERQLELVDRQVRALERIAAALEASPPAVSS
jgi:ATP-dependent Clp protease ATP-binding subunit ClpC